MYGGRPVRALAILGVSVAAVAGLAGCDPVPGVKVTIPNQHGPKEITIDLTTARSLTLRCGGDGRLTVNGTAFEVSCTDLWSVAVSGSPEADDLDIDLAPTDPVVVIDAEGGDDSVAAKGRLRVQAGDGDDQVTIDQRGANGLQVHGGLGHDELVVRGSGSSAEVHGDEGDEGDDDVTVGFDTRPYYASGNQIVDGGPGDDHLTDLGFVDPAPIAGANGQFPTTSLTGGTGADTLIGSDERQTSYSIDLVDTITFSTKTVRVGIQGTDGPDNVLVHNDGNYGPQITFDSGPLQRYFDLPDSTAGVSVNLAGGDDHLTIDHKSFRATVSADGGAGSDTVLLHPRNPFTRTQDREGNDIINQPGAGSWFIYRFEAITIDNVWP